MKVVLVVYYLRKNETTMKKEHLKQEIGIRDVSQTSPLASSVLAPDFTKSFLTSTKSVSPWTLQICQRILKDTRILRVLKYTYYMVIFYNVYIYIVNDKENFL